MANWYIFAAEVSIVVGILLTQSCGTTAGRSSSKVVVLPVPLVNSQYFNMLEIAEEIERRGNEVPFTFDLVI